MIGDLLRNYNSVQYYLNRAQGGAEINAFGATRIQNSAVAENNSPQPRDRISFRYNYFHNGQEVVGLSDAPPEYRPDIGVGVFTQATQGSNYDTHLYNWSFEKTFLDNLMSLEVRLPFQTGLSPHLNLRQSDNAVPGLATVNTPTGPLFGYFNPLTNGVQALPTSTAPAGMQPLQAFSVRSTTIAANTRGNEGNQFGNMSFIFKGILYQTSSFLLSGGLGTEIPTAPDTTIRVTDYLGGQASIFAEVQRVRDFHIANETWTLSPFLAFLSTPSPRIFTQGFLQFECPLNHSTYTYSDTFPLGGTRKFDNPALQFTPLFQKGKLDEQYLMHVDIGTGFWVYQNPDSRWFKGLAPTVELHYITTLNDADIIRLPSDNSFRRLGNNTFDRNAPGPEIGNVRNRVDILDLTLGATVLLGERSMLATAVVLPLKGSSDRTFDYEIQVQFNVFFGRYRPLSQVPPTF